MTNLGGVVQMLKDHLTKKMKAITAALSAFGAAYGRKAGTRGGMSLPVGQESRLLSEHDGRR